MRHSPTNRNLRPTASARLSADRSGAFMLELVVGAVLLGVFLGTAGPMLRWIHETKRTNDRHLVAMQELSTQMEKLAALPPAELSSQALQSLVVSEATQSLLPDSQLTASSTPDGEFMQRVTLTLSWTSHAGMAVEPKR